MDMALHARSTELDLAAQQRMVPLLLRWLAARHGEPVSQVETHLSQVLLAGGLAWKLHKALATDFADFRRLSQRLHDAHEELRLNRRLAEPLYLGLDAVTGSPAAPALQGWPPAAGSVLLDVAVRMRAFDPRQQWDVLLARGALTVPMLQHLAQRLAQAQAEAPVAAPADAVRAAERVTGPLRDTLATLRRLCPHLAPRWQALQDWAATQATALADWWPERQAGGFVREGHGDLHLANIAQVDGVPMPFDALAFDPALRWIDVGADLAFLRMDLAARQRPDLAGRLLDAWLQRTGDAGSLRGERHERVARALVRAKVAALRQAQALAARQESEAAAAEAAVLQALTLAERLVRPRRPALLLCCGLSGSGKSALGESLLDQGELVRWRSDIERKRLRGLAPLARSGSALDRGLYRPEAQAAVYRHLLTLAEASLAGGQHTLLDATFLLREQRGAAAGLARRLGLDCWILPFEAPPEVLGQRLRARRARGDDPSEADEAVLAAQMERAEPLDDDEHGRCWRPDAVWCGPDGRPQADWASLRARLDRAP
jgi:aminoglycoside phosphotransferase family enzyme/predicted kinase